MKKPFVISTSIVLLAALLVFNVGVPVYFYLCPMMSNEMPVCEMSPVDAGDTTSFTSITPDCCARIFVAERKTTPFILTANASYEHHDQPMAVIPIVQWSASGELGAFLVTPAELSSTPPPLYLLNSTLLI